MTVEREAEAAETEENETDDAPEDEGGGDDAAGGGGGGGGVLGASRSLGLERYVQFAFIAAALVMLWFLDKLATIVWDQFAEPNPMLTTAGAALVAIATTFFLWKHPVVNKLAHEVAVELSKVTWPSRRETYAATIIVIVTSIIAAVMIGLFDTLWSAFTDLVYKF